LFICIPFEVTDHFLKFDFWIICVIFHPHQCISIQLLKSYKLLEESCCLAFSYFLCLFVEIHTTCRLLRGNSIYVRVVLQYSLPFTMCPEIPVCCVVLNSLLSGLSCEVSLLLLWLWLVEFDTALPLPNPKWSAFSKCYRSGVPLLLILPGCLDKQVGLRLNCSTPFSTLSFWFSRSWTKAIFYFAILASPLRSLFFIK
jgi:hypothetical protein